MSRPKQSMTHEVVIKAQEEFEKIKDGKLATQLRAIMAFEENNAEEIAKIFKISIRTFFRWVHKFSSQGIEGLKDQPKGHYKSKLTISQRDQIKNWIKKGINSDNEYIHWTLEKLKNEVEIKYNVEISTTALWKNLKKMGLAVKKPRPFHHKADKKLQEDFKKNCN